MRIGKSLSNPTLWLTTTGIVVSLVVGFSFYWAMIPSREFSSVKENYRQSDIWVVDRNGNPLERIRTNNQKRSLNWVKWSEISTSFQNLLIQTEDRRFFSHYGIDLRAVAGSLWGNIRGKTHRGASTLTMQLAGLLRGEKSIRRGWRDKVNQALAALKIETSWAKDEILEGYVNLVGYRGELIGLRAASMGYFAKDPSGLNEEESALLVALLRSPNADPNLVAIRACVMIKRTDCSTVHALSSRVFSRPYRLERTREILPVLSDRILTGEKKPNVIQTTLDQRVQIFAMKALQNQLRSLGRQNVNDGAALILETKTGRVVAYAANGGASYSSSKMVDGIQSRRQAGSTLKPFLYATAFEEMLLTPTSLLDDSPADISVAEGRVYHPRNYDKSFRGLVNAADALGSSLNVPAVRVMSLVGESRLLDNLRALGFQKLYDDDYYGLSLALGSIDVTLWELTHGYRQLAMDSSVFSETTRSSIFNILAQPEHRRFTFGMNSMLSLPFPAAVKTGTSKDMRDNWCIGWTPEFTVGVWVGNFNGEPMWNVSGMSGAAPIWRSLMLALHPDLSQSLARGVSSTETPSQVLPVQTLSRIRYPVAGMLVGVDPDIPAKLQRIPVEIENPQSSHQLFLNNRNLGHALPTTLVPVVRGKYRVDLRDPNGKLVDQINFEVR